LETLPHPQTFSDDERRMTLAALLIVFLLSALDQTIVSTAMPRIVGELHGLNFYSWVTTAYLLSSTVMVPIWGKLSDLHGRKPVLVAGISLFLAGSWMAGLSGEFGDLPLLGGGMSQLIIFRALQGIGGGALFSTAFAIIADLFAPRERGKFSGLFGGIFGLASVIGPVVGGFFTEHGTVRLLGHVVAGWRWVFYLNLPLSLLSLFMILVKMPKLTHHGGGPIDYLGAALIVLTFVPLLLAMSLGGHDYAWSSPQITGLLVLSAAALAAFLYVERGVREPIIPLELFANRTFTLVNAAAFIVGMAFMGVVTFLPLYLQVGRGVPATVSGLAMLPMMAGMIASTTANGFLVSHTGRYKPFMLTGAVMLLLGFLLMSFIGPTTSLFGVGWRLLVLGIGLGPSQSLFSLAVQNAVSPRQIGVATSSSQFVRQIGSTIGVALFGAVLTHGLNQELARRAPPDAAGAHQTMDMSRLQAMALARVAGPHAGAASLSPALLKATGDSFNAAIVGVFRLAMTLMAGALAVMLYIPALPMRSRFDPPPAPSEA
jgi:EmrB/QacA subfamily drug resistance transporter